MSTVTRRVQRDLKNDPLELRRSLRKEYAELYFQNVDRYHTETSEGKIFFKFWPDTDTWKHLWNKYAEVPAETWRTILRQTPRKPSTYHNAHEASLSQRLFMEII